MNLLNRNDEPSPDVWNLIRSLATNQKLYKKVLSFTEAKDENEVISWDQFFGSGSMYRQIYNLEIIEELMEAGNVISKDNKRVSFVEM